MDLQPVVLEGTHVRLDPLTLEHQAAFCEAGREWSLTPDAVRAGIEAALAQQRAGLALPFATVAKASGQVVGGTRFLNISQEHRHLEIGSTWISSPWRRTAINTEAKFLMLEHAFERLGCVRVEFQVDALNEPSRVAVLRLGAKEEGTLRSYRVNGAGETQDIVIYSDDRRADPLDSLELVLHLSGLKIWKLKLTPPGRWSARRRSGRFCSA